MRFSAKSRAKKRKSGCFALQFDRICNTKQPLLLGKTIGILGKTTAFTFAFVSIFCTLSIINHASNTLSTTYRCSLIRVKKPTTKFIFRFTAFLRGVRDANIVHLGDALRNVASLLDRLCKTRQPPLRCENLLCDGKIL